jgi:hypothetical protein
MTGRLMGKGTNTDTAERLARRFSGQSGRVGFVVAAGHHIS